MSRRLQDLFWDVDLTSTEQLVAQRLAWHANDEDGKCWPGMRLLCEKTGLSDRAIQKAIKSLEAAGHLTREEALGLGVVYFVHPRTSCGGQKNGIAPARKPDVQGGETPEAGSGAVEQSPPNGVRPRTSDAPEPGSPTPERRSGKQVKNREDDKHGERPRDAQAAATGQRGQRIDLDWLPTKPLPDDLAKVVAGWPPGREAEELAEFRDFWLADAGQRASKMDWDRTWWNRIRSIAKYDRRRQETDRRHATRPRHDRSRSGNGLLSAVLEAEHACDP